MVPSEEVCPTVTPSSTGPMMTLGTRRRGLGVGLQTKTRGRPVLDKTSPVVQTFHVP